jgi:hypothetical protein
MAIYWIIFILLFGVSLFSIFIRNKNALFVKYGTYSLFVFFLIFVGTRYYCGFDYGIYTEPEFLVSFSDIFSYLKYEPGYILIRSFFNNYLYFFLFFAFLSLAPKFVTFYKYSPLIFFTVFLYYSNTFLQSEMGQIRQAVATGFVFLAIFNKNSKIHFLLYLSIALLFHFSAIICLLIMFIPSKFLKFSTYIISLLSVIVIYIVFSSIMEIIIQNSTGLINGKLNYYLTNEVDYKISPLLLSVYAFIFLIVLIYRKTIMKIKYAPYLFNIYFVSLIIYLGFSFFPQISGRGAQYYNSVVIFLLPIIVNEVKNMFEKFVLYTIISIIYGTIFFNFLIKFEFEFNPYVSWLFS